MMPAAWTVARRLLPALAPLLALATTLHAADIPHLDLAVRLDPGTRMLQAVAELESPREVRIRLHRSLAIHEASVDGKPVVVRAPATSGESGVWHLTLGARGRLRIAYGGTLPALDANLDHRGVLRIATPAAAAAGSFLPSSGHWHPRPREPFTYRVTLALPGEQRGLVAGDLREETLPTPSQPDYRATFVFGRPAEGIDLMTGPYTIDERLVTAPGREPLRLRTYFTPALRDLAAGYLDDSARYIEHYSRLIGAYPYASFSVVASPLPTGFGMPTLTYMGAEVLKLPFMRGTSLGHEVLHNWWGNGVHPDYAGGNWSEGLTTFMADYAYKERDSASAAREMRLAWMRDMASVPPEARVSLAQFRSRTHGAEAAVGYGKSAMVFFMLRDLLGTEAYERGIRRFWEEHRFRTASWDDLRQAFEQASGRPLRVFFDQWLSRVDAPRLTLSGASATAAERGFRLSVRIAQATTPPYALRVPLAVQSGSSTTLHVVDVDQAHTTVTLPLDAKPDAVRLDPDLRVWRRLDAAELPPILRRWIVARAPRYFVASGDARFERTAGQLAQRLFEMPAERVPTVPVNGSDEPLLLVGLQRDIDVLLDRLQLPPRPPELPAHATAQVWTVARPPQHGGIPVAVIAVRDAQALEALLRPLPHYGAQSYLAFDGSRAIVRGVWPATAPATPVAWR